MIDVIEDVRNEFKIKLNDKYKWHSYDFTSTGLKNDLTRNAIESIVWNLGGTASYTSASNGLASHFYGYEIGYYRWTLVLRTSYSDPVFYVIDVGYVSHNYASYVHSSARQSAFLKSNISITDVGNGTLNSPYQLSLK